MYYLDYNNNIHTLHSIHSHYQPSLERSILLFEFDVAEFIISNKNEKIEYDEVKKIAFFAYKYALEIIKPKNFKNFSWKKDLKKKYGDNLERLILPEFDEQIFLGINKMPNIIKGGKKKSKKRKSRKSRKKSRKSRKGRFPHKKSRNKRR